MPTLTRAILLATEAHAGQADKVGEPFILHPLRVMLRGTTDAERIVGVLHDIVEKTGWTLDALRAEGFAEDIVRGVDALTHREAEGEDYMDFVRRAASDPVGRVVKRADLEDNLEMSRRPEPEARDRERIRRYDRALELLDTIEAGRTDG